MKTEYSPFWNSKLKSKEGWLNLLIACRSWNCLFTKVAKGFKHGRSSSAARVYVNKLKMNNSSRSPISNIYIKLKTSLGRVIIMITLNVKGRIPLPNRIKRSVISIMVLRWEISITNNFSGRSSSSFNTPLWCKQSETLRITDYKFVVVVVWQQLPVDNWTEIELD